MCLVGQNLPGKPLLKSTHSYNKRAPTPWPSRGRAMKISSQEEYGLRCLLRLARAEDGQLSIADIAAGEGLSVPYVAKLLTVLRQGGLIDSVRGRAGGYHLAQPPEE